MLYKPWSHWTRWRTSHNHQLQYLSNSKTTSNSCCINLGHTGPDGVQVTIISYNIQYQTLKLLVTHVVLTLAFKFRNKTTKKLYKYCELELQPESSNRTQNNVKISKCRYKIRLYRSTGYLAFDSLKSRGTYHLDGKSGNSA